MGSWILRRWNESRTGSIEMKQKQTVEELDEDTFRVTTTTDYTKEEYRRTFAPAMAVERILNQHLITADYCVEEGK